MHTLRSSRYRLTPRNITDLVNKDTGNAEGDAFFTLDEYRLRSMRVKTRELTSGTSSVQNIAAFSLHR